MTLRKQTYKAKITLITLFLLAVSGCSQPTNTIYKKPTITKAELLSGHALFDPHNTDLSLPEAEVMAISDKLKNYLHQNISKSASQSQKLRQLLSLMFLKGNMGISYDRSQTLTAEGTFRSGSGNCLGVSYLFTSLAKELGLKTHFRNVNIPPAWSMEEDLIYRYRHVNVEVVLQGKRFIIDADEVNNVPTYETNRISTRNVVAQYYSNKGAHFLADKDNLNAFRHFKKAIDTDSSQAEFWANLGVLYKKEGKYDYAESAYLIALDLQHNNLTTLNNMASLYNAMGMETERDKYKVLAARKNDRNPYFRYIEATKAYDDEAYEISLQHIEQAIVYEKNAPEFYELLSKVYNKSGHPDKAQIAKNKGREVARGIQQRIDNQAIKIKYRKKEWEIPVKYKTRNQEPT